MSLEITAKVTVFHFLDLVPQEGAAGTAKTARYKIIFAKAATKPVADSSPSSSELSSSEDSVE